jgi:lysophospholipase L1-like esterase
MFTQKAKAYSGNTLAAIGIALGLLVVIELVGWVVTPGRYVDPPPVTADAWIHSDAISRQDTVWMKQFVDEFCASYKARWTSYVYYRRVPFAGDLINVDSNGIRRTPQVATQTPLSLSPLRIVLFGGSTMWGTCSRDSGTIPSALARNITASPANRPCEVVNMGESGYVSTQAIIRLQLELRKGNIPDIVILYDGVNDIFSSYQNGVAGMPQNESHRATEFNLLKEPERMRRLGFVDFWNRTVTAGIVSGIHSSIAAPVAVPTPPRQTAEDIVQLYTQNLKIVEALSRQFGFRYEAYWQPVVFTRANPSAYEGKEAERMAYVRSLFLDVYGRVARDPLLTRNPRFHNLSTVFDTEASPVYLDFCHISETGNAIVARRMYADIEKSVRSPKGRTSPPRM